MRRAGYYTCRGQVSEADTDDGLPHKISLFDGKFTTAYRVIDFEVFPSSLSSSSNSDVIGKLSKSENSSTASATFWNADDDNEIAWAGCAGSTDSMNAPMFKVIDDENMIIEDLYVYARTPGTASNPINYLVKLEKYQITEARGALSMARDASVGE